MSRIIIVTIFFNFLVFNLIADELKFITHELKPFAWKDSKGDYHGIVYELCKETIKRMGYNSDNIEVYPFIRALKTVQEEDNYVLFPVARTLERETTLKWVGPAISNNVYFYKLKQNKTELKTLSDLKNLKYIGVGRGNASEALLIKEGFKNLHDVTNEMNAVKMLALGRVEAVPVGEMVVNEMMEQANVDKNKIQKTDIKLTDSILYIAFSKNIPDSEIAKWQTMFETVKNEKYDALYKKYIDH